MDSGLKIRCSEFTSFCRTGTSPGDVAITYTYNRDNLLTKFEDTGAVGPDFTFGGTDGPQSDWARVDGLGRLRNATETIDSVTYDLKTYNYDMRSQLNRAEYEKNSIDFWEADYTYKKNGDMDTRTIDTTKDTSFTYTGNLMVDASSSSGGDNFTLAWDENGNMEQLPDDTVTTDLTYNWDNKLRHGQYDTKTVDLKYDPFGNRIYKDSSEDGDPHKYIVDIVGDLPVILMDLQKQGQSYNIKKIYIYANSQIIAQHDGDTSDDLYFYLHDRLGSVRLMIDTANPSIVKNRYTYRPFGELFASELTENVSNPFRFTGQYHDTEIDEYYLRARQYHPYIGRFTSRDPVAGKFQEPLTLHKYLYCINDPINKLDPFGRDYVDFNFTWTYGMAAGALQGSIIGGGASWNPVGAGIGAAFGMAAGGLGFTGGVMYERDMDEAHFYLGPSWTTNIAGGIDFTASLSPSPDTTVESGWHAGFSLTVGGIYNQWTKRLGFEGEGSKAWEVGLSTGTSQGYSVSASVFYVFPGMGMPSFIGGDPRSAFSELSLLDRAIMMNEMREDTAELFGRGQAGIPLISNYGITADVLLGM